MFGEVADEKEKGAFKFIKIGKVIPRKDLELSTDSQQGGIDSCVDGYSPWIRVESHYSWCCDWAYIREIREATHLELVGERDVEGGGKKMTRAGEGGSYRGDVRVTLGATTSDDADVVIISSSSTSPIPTPVPGATSIPLTSTPPILVSSSLVLPTYSTSTSPVSALPASMTRSNMVRSLKYQEAHQEAHQNEAQATVRKLQLEAKLYKELSGEVVKREIALKRKSVQTYKQMLREKLSDQTFPYVQRGAILGMQVAHDLLDIPNVQLGALASSNPIVAMSEQEVNTEDEGDDNARS
ncbi:hypothetical protein Goshw_011827 [Gossypium schwendimanii]|uniref:Uncharacterized protein n=1 Tax=Gossypium schwendimanii TaxID=34291 RepID=A0A7J9N504_GOSSC|nr:hypothetical protein [Gossypium schwendimanii]